MESPSRDGSLPVPISLTVYNRLPPPPVPLVGAPLVVHSDMAIKNKTAYEDYKIPGVGDSDIASAPPPNKKWFRPDYTVSLLISVRLEMYVKRETCEGIAAYSSSQMDVEEIIFSSTIHQSAIHPVWDHLNERVPFDPEDKLDSEWGKRLRSIFARVILVDKDDPSGLGTILVESVPLHPHALRRLPRDSNEDSYATPVPPASLPPNAVLIHYSDGLVRVKPSLYHVLLQHNVIQEVDPRDLSLIHDDDEEDKHRSRFDDNLFDILGKAHATLQPSTAKVNESSLFDTAHLSVPSGNSHDDGVNTDDKFWKCSPIDVAEDEVDKSNLQLEHVALLMQIKENERLLLEDELALRNQMEFLQLTMKAVNDLEEETTCIKNATARIMSDEQQVDFVISLCRRRLTRELQQIYPISIKNQDRYFIANTELPLDLFRGQVNDDEISASLGYLAHTIVMLSKYLDVALRYRIVCNSSRSAVQDDDSGGDYDDANQNTAADYGVCGKILPLFLSRMVDRAQVERGLALLHRNLDCIARTRGLILAEFEQPHVLAKLSQIYDKVANG